MSVINNRAEQPGEGMGIGGETTSPLTPRHTTMARFGFSGDLGNADSITGLGWSFEGFSKGKGAKKTINLSGDVNQDGSFGTSFRSSGKKVKGWLNYADTQGEIANALSPNFSYQGKSYDFTPGDRIKIKLSSKGRFQVVDHDLSLEREQTRLTLGDDVRDQGQDDPITGSGEDQGNSSQSLTDLLQQLDSNRDGRFNLEDLRLPTSTFTLQSLQDRFGLDQGTVDAIAEQNNPIQGVIGPITESWIQTGGFNSPLLQPLLQPGGITDPLPQIF